MSFDDTGYAIYFTCEHMGIFLALLRQKWKVNEIYLAIIGLCLSLVEPMLLAFANSNELMIFGG